MMFGVSSSTEATTRALGIGGDVGNQELILASPGGHVEK